MEKLIEIGASARWLCYATLPAQFYYSTIRVLPAKISEQFAPLSRPRCVPGSAVGHNEASSFDAQAAAECQPIGTKWSYTSIWP
jgi:hypothetical protein